jgi:hypothetical protein
MKQVPLRQVESVTPLIPYRLAVVWRDGKSAIVDLTDDIKSGGVWSAIAPNEKFARVRVAERGRAIEWPDPRDDDGEALIDIDSEALYITAMRQMAEPVMQAILEQLRKRH